MGCKQFFVIFHALFRSLFSAERVVAVINCVFKQSSGRDTTAINSAMKFVKFCTYVTLDTNYLYDAINCCIYCSTKAKHKAKTIKACIYTLN